MENRTFWQKVFSLKPLTMEKDLEMDHKYDEIAELDNPTPPWFMYLFYRNLQKLHCLDDRRLSLFQ